MVHIVEALSVPVALIKDSIIKESFSLPTRALFKLLLTGLEFSYIKTPFVSKWILYLIQLSRYTSAIW